MKLLASVVEEGKKLPRVVWVAAVVLPGGFTALGVWFAGKGVYNKLKKEKK